MYYLPDSAEEMIYIPMEKIASLLMLFFYRPRDIGVCIYFSMEKNPKLCYTENGKNKKGMKPMKKGKQAFIIILLGIVILGFGAGDIFFLYQKQKSMQIEYVETETEQKDSQEQKKEIEETVYTSSLEGFSLANQDTRSKREESEKDKDTDNEVAELENLKATASSELEPEGENTYYASHLLDDSLKTAWVEGVKGNGEGGIFTIESNESVVVKKIEIFNGYQKNEDVLKRNAQVKNIKITASDGSTKTVSLKKIEKCGNSEMIEFDTGENGVTSVEFEILSTYSGQDTAKGAKASDTCISEVHLYGYTK